MNNIRARINTTTPSKYLFNVVAKQRSQISQDKGKGIRLALSRNRGDIAVFTARTVRSKMHGTECNGSDSSSVMEAIAAV